MEGVKLAGATGWVPADLSKAQLARADLSGCDLSGVDLSHANLNGTNLNNVNLWNCDLQGAQGWLLSTVNVEHMYLLGKQCLCQHLLLKDLKVNKLLVFALAEESGLSLSTVNLTNQFNHSQSCAKNMEILTVPMETGPWSSVLNFVSGLTYTLQKIQVSPDAPIRQSCCVLHL